jgi:hypothetical protein
MGPQARERQHRHNSERKRPTGLYGVALICFDTLADNRSRCVHENIRHCLSVLPGLLSSRRVDIGERKSGPRTMYRLRRAVGILAGTEVEGLSAYFAAGTQVFDRSRAAVSDVVLTA